MVFTSAIIENFRGIRHCKLEGLGQVNIFFGKNNCGKSSLLEALFLLSGQSNPTLPLNINAFRGVSINEAEDLLALFYHADKDNSIRIEAEGERGRAVKIDFVEKHEEQLSPGEPNRNNSSVSNMKYGLNFEYNLKEQNQTTYHSALTMTEEGKNGKADIDKYYKETFVAEYVSPASKNNDRKYLENVIKNKKEGEIIELLKVLEPRIREIQIVGQKIMVDVGLPTRLPVNMLGDGVRRLLSIILTIYIRRNGVVLIDEVENGLHYSAMNTLWKALLNTSMMTNTQLFITTHSLDTLKTLADTLQDMDGKEAHVAAYKLIRKEDDELVPLRYESSQLAYAIKHDVEVR